MSMRSLLMLADSRIGLNGEMIGSASAMAGPGRVIAIHAGGVDLILRDTPRAKRDAGDVLSDPGGM
jgi:hypothetical protein